MEQKSAFQLQLEVAAALLTPAALFGFIRVFDATSALTPMIITALVSTLLAAGMRLLKVPLLLAMIVSFGTLLGFLVYRFTPGTATAMVIPTGATIEEARFLAQELVASFKEQRSPVTVNDAFLAPTLIAAWIMAFLTDWGALRLKLAFEPVLPPTLLFVFASIPPINSKQHQVVATLVFGSAVGIWAITQRYSKFGKSLTWLGGNKKKGLNVMVASGVVLTTIAVTSGALYGHMLPGAQDKPWYDLDDKASERVVTNPYLDLRDRLANQTDDVLFNVTASDQAYWRMVGLKTYKNRNTADDNGFSTSVWEVKIGGDSKDSRFKQPELPTSNATLKHTVDIRSLSIQRRYDGEAKVDQNVWVPAALSPIKVLDSTKKLSTDNATQTITVDEDEEEGNTQNLVYSVESALPKYTEAQLQEASRSLQPDFSGDDIYLELPSAANGQYDIPPIVEQTAKEVTADANGRYEQMVALQNHFQGYEYSLDLPPLEPGEDALESFLNTRIGFCQQFSGTFAVMARQLGVPARVAVGFTWGEPVGTNEAGEAIYEVRGKHAHAWPEVYFGEELGWVPFEPTPGRGLPGSTDYTGLPSAQDSTVDPGGQTTPEPEPEPLPEPEPAPQPEGGQSESPEAQEPAEPKEVSFTTFDADTSFSFAFLKNFLSKWWKWIGFTVLLLAYPVLLPAFYSLKRNLRRNKITGLLQANNPLDNAKGATLSWQHIQELCMVSTQHRQLQSETCSEFAARLPVQTYQNPAALYALANTSTLAAYSPEGISNEQGAQAFHASNEVEKTVKQNTTFFSRYLNLLGNPLILFKGTKRQGDKSTTPSLAPA